MTSKPRLNTGGIRVLLATTGAQERTLIADLLSGTDEPIFHLEIVTTFDTAVNAIRDDRHDVYLIDDHLGAVDGLELLEHVKQNDENPPVIIISDGANAQSQVLSRGAADFLLKSDLSRPLLTRAIRYTLERSRLEHRLAELAQYDELTGLPNRELFRELVAGALARARRTEQSLVLLLLDLDGFKTVNDALGHKTGDRLLKEAADRIKDTLRESDTVARLGGDEFIVILEGLARARDAGFVAQRILNEIARPFEIADRDVFSSASIGIAVYDRDDQSVDTLIKNADMAIFRAKQRGRNSYEFHTAEMTVEVLERMTLEVNMRRALLDDEFVLHYQPQLDIKSGRITGVEALVRWMSPEMGLVPPIKFIPLAEETGLIIPLGEWVLREACRQNVAWRRAGLPAMRVAVNLSARQFHRSLAGTVQKVLDEVGMDADQLELELTEGHLAENAEEGIATLEALKAMGVHISIDDFGAGYSSLSHLKRFPVDTLKIDRSFVRDLPTGSKDCAIASTVINLAHNLNLKALAEGVETGEQLAWLRDRGCDAMQGYLLSRPLPAEEIPAWIEARVTGRTAVAG